MVYGDVNAAQRKEMNPYDLDSYGFDTSPCA